MSTAGAAGTRAFCSKGDSVFSFPGAEILNYEINDIGNAIVKAITRI